MKKDEKKAQEKDEPLLTEKDEMLIIYQYMKDRGINSISDIENKLAKL